jgi:hypothetical protein
MQSFALFDAGFIHIDSVNIGSGDIGSVNIDSVNIGDVHILAGRARTDARAPASEKLFYGGPPRIAW